MPYTPTTWNNDAPPSINADNLNNMESGISNAVAKSEQNETDIQANANAIEANTQQIATNQAVLDDINTDNILNKAQLSNHETRISKNETDIGSLSSGTVEKGAFTPSAGTEYPSSGTNWKYTIGNLSVSGYTFTSGDLNGETAYNLDQIIYTTSGWSLISVNAITGLDAGMLDENRTLFKANLLNSIHMEKGVGSIAHDAPSSSTFINRYGQLETAGVDESGHNEKGMRFDATSTNLCLYSESFDNAAYTLSSNVTITPNIVGDPSGVTAFSDKIKKSANTFAVRGQTVIGGIGLYSASVFVRGGDLEKATISLNNGDSTSITRALLNTNTGVLTAQVGSVENCKAERIGLNWWRISVSGEVTVANPQIRVYPGDPTESAPGFMIFWGAQLEPLPYATSYIPTEGSTEARLQAVTSFPTKNNMPDISKGATLWMEFTAEQMVGNPYLYSVYEDGDEYFYIRLSGDTLTIRSEAGGVIEVSLGITGMSSYLNTPLKLCVVFSEGKVEAYINGALERTDIGTYSMPDMLGDKTTLGAYTFTGHIKYIEWQEGVPTPTEIALRQGGE